MATICFKCGNCKANTASKIIDYKIKTESTSDGEYIGAKVELIVNCANCNSFSILNFYTFDHDKNWSEEFIRLNTILEADHLLHDEITTQFPELIKTTPQGIKHREISQAWYEAELTFSDGRLSTPAGLAYRRVIDIAVQKMTPTAKKKMPLGQRVKLLSDNNEISEELAILIHNAKAFGDEAAHGDPLSRTDSQIARDLCEAFLRQAFTVPHLIEKAKVAAQIKNECPF